jgi:hypothetical protein
MMLAGVVIDGAGATLGRSRAGEFNDREGSRQSPFDPAPRRNSMLHSTLVPLKTTNS